MVRRLLAFGPLLTLLLCLYAVDLPLFVESPGQAKSVLPLIDVDGTPTYDSSGRMLLTTVNIGRANVYYTVRGWLDPAATIVSERDLIPPGQSDLEYERRSFSQMDQSKISAVSVALERLTEYPEEHGRGVIVHDAYEDAPAAGRLFPGDLIVEADGVPIEDQAHLSETIAASGGERVVRFTVRPLEGGDEEVVSIRPIPDPGDPSRLIIGISSLANFPFTVRIESGEIGGPSAGLMWALGVTDLLTPDDLTDRGVVAGTGTVDPGGNVGPIGGVLLKIEAAERAGAGVFLLPQDNMAEARAAETDLRLVPVSTVDQAVGFLEARA